MSNKKNNIGTSRHLDVGLGVIRGTRMRQFIYTDNTLNIVTYGHSNIFYVTCAQN